MSFVFDPNQTARFALQLAPQLPVMITRRLVLRSAGVHDFDTYASLVCTARPGAQAPLTPEQAWLAFAEMTSPEALTGQRLWAIGYHGGVAGFVALDLDQDAPELTVTLRPATEGQDVGFEAATAICAHLFDTLACDSVLCAIAPENHRAARLARRMGFARAGTRQGFDLWRGHAPGKAAA
ncbi:MAG: GNAT family N-acetyltransferase [Roseobacter sp.]